MIVHCSARSHEGVEGVIEDQCLGVFYSTLILSAYRILCKPTMFFHSLWHWHPAKHTEQAIPSICFWDHCPLHSLLHLAAKASFLPLEPEVPHAMSTKQWELHEHPATHKRIKENCRSWDCWTSCLRKGRYSLLWPVWLTSLSGVTMTDLNYHRFL